MNSKKNSANIFMAIGVLLIILSGGFFVTSSWGSFSNEVKELCLFIPMILLFAGHYYVKQKLQLQKTAVCLYYLGVAATAFLGYMLLSNYTAGNFQFSVSVSLLIALAFIIVKIAREKFFLDFILATILVDSFTISLNAEAGNEVNILLISWAVILIGLSFLCKNKNRLFEAEPMIQKTLLILASVQFIACFLHLTLIFFPNWIGKVAEGFVMYAFSGELTEQEFDQWISGNSQEMAFGGIFHYSRPVLLVAPFLAGSLVIALYMVKDLLGKLQEENIKLFKNAGWCIFLATLLLDLNRIIHLNVYEVVFIIFSILMAAQIVMKEKEILYILGFVGMAIEFAEFVFGNVNDYNTLLPYPLVCAVVLLIKWGLDKKEKVLLHIGIYQGIMQIVLLYLKLGKTELSLQGVVDISIIPFLAYVALLVLTAAEFVKFMPEKIWVRSIGVGVATLAFCLMPLHYIPMEEVYYPEWIAMAIFLGMGFFSFAWRGYKNVRATVQRIGLLVPMGILLAHSIGGEHNTVCISVHIVTFLLIMFWGIYKNRKYQWITGLVMLVIEVLIATKEYWSEMPWWCYFLVAGIGFIVMAVIYEKKDSTEEESNHGDKNITEDNQVIEG